MRAANDDFKRCPKPKTRQNHHLPPAAAGNGQLRIMVCNTIIDHVDRPVVILSIKGLLLSVPVKEAALRTAS